MNYQTQQDPVKKLSNWETRIIILGKRRDLSVIFGVDLLELCMIFSYNPVFDSKKEKESLNPACLLEFQRFFLFYELW